MKLSLTNNSHYIEIGQRNSLRWKTLFKEADGSFVDQSGWIKCKDFFNDTVAYFKEGSKFSIYGYKNDIKKNEEGVYMLLRYIADMPSFLRGLEVMNTRLYADLNCTVGHLPVPNEKDQLVVLIPNELWESTYRISMVTFVIRLCNYGYKYNKWDDFWNTAAPSYTMEYAFSNEAKANALKYGFKEPDGFEAYWWYCGPEFNSKKKPGTTGGTIHNNGVSNWSHFIGAAK